MKRDYTLSGEIRFKAHEPASGYWVLSPAGAIDSSTSQELKKHTEDLLAKNPAAHLLLDISEVPYISSMGLGTILGLLKKQKEKNASFHLYDPQIPVRRVLEISKLDFLLVRAEASEPNHPLQSYFKTEEPKRKLRRELWQKEHEKKTREISKSRSR